MAQRIPIALLSLAVGLAAAGGAPAQNPGQGSAPGQVRENPKDGLKYVWIPPGSFMMGCSRGDNECRGDERPAHRVRISKGFWIGQTEVTVGAYRSFTTSTGRQMPSEPMFNPGWANDNMPMVNVNWDDAQRYCTWAGGRLLKEAEWEYAARGGTTVSRYGNLDEIAWYSSNSANRAQEVAQKHANGFGLLDILGNVWEWVNDWWDPKYYQKSPAQDPPGPASGQMRGQRGGSWIDSARAVRVSFRGHALPHSWDYFDGIRCGRDVINP